MKRDMDLIRELLLKLEEMNLPFATERYIEVWESPLDYDKDRQSEVLGHLRLLSEAQFIDGAPSAMNWNLKFRGLTWRGHDFLDSIRDPEIWAKTKAGANAAGGFTVELLGEIAKGLIKTKIKQHTGIDI